MPFMCYILYNYFTNVLDRDEENIMIELCELSRNMNWLNGCALN